jgi:DNA-binding PadR family transcriptional regulator
MSKATLHILLALSEGKRHGYAIAEEVTELSGGRVRLGPASLYGNLQRLLDAGWIQEVDAPRNVDERRRYYQLTHPGRMAIDEEIKQMEAILRKARARRAPPAPSKS